MISFYRYSFIYIYVPQSGGAHDEILTKSITILTTNCSKKSTPEHGNRITTDKYLNISYWKDEYCFRTILKIKQAPMTSLM